jgi:hypothetical protein
MPKVSTWGADRSQRWHFFDLSRAAGVLVGARTGAELLRDSRPRGCVGELGVRCEGVPGVGLGGGSGVLAPAGAVAELLRNPIVEERLVNCMCQRSRRQSEWQLVLARGSVRARLAWHLVDLAQRFGERDERTKEIFVPIALTQEQQAQLIGATRARLWEARREFEHKRWLICGPEGFWVRNEEALRRQSLEEF